MIIFLRVYSLSFLFLAGSAGLWNISRRGVPKIRRFEGIKGKKYIVSGFFLFSAGSAGSWSVSRRGVPKIRKINDANFLLDIGMKSFYSEGKASDVCPEA